MAGLCQRALAGTEASPQAHSSVNRKCQLHTRTHTHTHARTHAHTHTHAHAQAHTRARTHTHTRTHTPSHFVAHNPDVWTSCTDADKCFWDYVFSSKFTLHSHSENTAQSHALC